MATNAWPEAKWVVDQLKKNVGGGGGGGGIAPSNLLNLVCSKDRNLAIKLYYTWPEDTTIEGQTFVSVRGCKVVLYEGASTGDETGGTLIHNSITKNQYKTNPYVISGDKFVDGKTYTIHVYPYSDQGVVNRNMANSFTFVARNRILYGCKVDTTNSGSEARVTYLSDCDNATFTPAKMNLTTGVMNYGSWADAWFIKGCKPCMLKYDGTVDYYLNPNDYTKRENGAASDVANTAYGGNVMVEIPLVWMKTYTSGNYQYYYFCDIQLDSTYKAYPFINSAGVTMSKTYMPAYCGANVSNKLRSISGLAPVNTQTGTTEITLAEANNPTGKKIWYTEVFSDRQLINALLLLIGRSTNGQTTFGNGYTTGGTAASSLMNSGTMNNKGLFYGTSGNVGVKVFGIEHWWGNIWRRIGGYVNASGTQKIKLTYGKEDGSTTIGYNTDGTGYITIANATPGGTNGGYVNASVVNEYGWFPKTASGSETTYECDGLWFNNAQNNYAFVGGYCSDGSLCGPWGVVLHSAVSHASWGVGASLSCKPT